MYFESGTYVVAVPSSTRVGPAGDDLSGRALHWQHCGGVPHHSVPSCGDSGRGRLFVNDATAICVNMWVIRRANAAQDNGTVRTARDVGSVKLNQYGHLPDVF